MERMADETRLTSCRTECRTDISDLGTEYQNVIQSTNGGIGCDG